MTTAAVRRGQISTIHVKHFSRTENKRASLKVVHKHGPCYQFSEDKTNAPNLTHILLQDQARVNSLQSRLSNNLHDSESTLPAKSGFSLGTANYVITVGLGTPKKDLTFAFDTGSDLTWTQCKPCAGYCYPQNEPYFDPSKSTSYTNITCGSPSCSQLLSATNNPPRCSSSTCVYTIGYADMSYTIGFFGKEKLSLTSADVFEDFPFGCGQENRGLFGRIAGLFGLGRDKLSFVSQSAFKYGSFFSYCLPSSPSSTGHLKFGKGGGAPTNEKFTPLLTKSRFPSFYFIDVVAISVGGQKLSIPSSVFSTAGTIIDSGTVITRLPATAYAALRSAFRQRMSKYPMTQPLEILDTCYDLSQYSSVSIPRIMFSFGGGVEVDVDLSGILFGAKTSQLCLAVAGNGGDTAISTFGNYQQKRFDVIYDVAGGQLGFAPGGCA
ncbi:hypothetical protein L1049_018557 [Liquidambar formosana]|uniref:Peptidase A1 domain-containing protein n=1 Tax=Liquidambar formosana TaxID=63359 RepID=A0AAP0RA87_LIQFO